MIHLHPQAMACFLSKSHERDMSAFSMLTPKRQKEIARTVQGYLDDMLMKVEPFRQRAVELKKSTWFQTKRREEELKTIDDL